MSDKLWEDTLNFRELLEQKKSILWTHLDNDRDCENVETGCDVRHQASVDSATYGPV